MQTTRQTTMTRRDTLTFASASGSEVITHVVIWDANAKTSADIDVCMFCGQLECDCGGY